MNNNEIKRQQEIRRTIVQNTGKTSVFSVDMLSISCDKIVVGHSWHNTSQHSSSTHTSSHGWRNYV